MVNTEDDITTNYAHMEKITDMRWKKSIVIYGQWHDEPSVIYNNNLYLFSCKENYETWLTEV